MRIKISLLLVLLIVLSGYTFGQDFTIGVIPDWQKLTYLGTDGAKQMKKICQWFADNKKDLNIVFVSSLGDMSQGNYKDTTYSADQWKRNKDALSILLKNGIPFSVNQGNHDPYIAINKCFPVSYFEKEPYWGGSMNGKIENSYYKFEASGMKFILLTAQWAKSSSVNSWANKIFKENSDRRAIFIAHSGLSKEVINDTYLVDPIVRQHDNIFLGLMGHLCESEGEEYWTTTSPSGKLQHLIRSDYQCRGTKEEPASILRYYTFKPSKDRVYAYTYNLRTQSYVTDSCSQFSFHYEMESVTTELGNSSTMTKDIADNKKSDVMVFDLRVEGQINPIGLDNITPSFSWKLESNQRNRYQSAYQIVVQNAKTFDIYWDSGIVPYDNNIMVRYSGIPFMPSNTYTWKVRIKDNFGKLSKWSDLNTFATGLFNEKDWKASWICAADSLYAPLFLREFTISKNIDEAFIYVNCQGYYELYINDEKVGDDVLSPAVSDFRYKNYYLTYDISKYLRYGKNTIGVYSGRGWYSPGLPGVTHSSPVFRCQTNIISGNDTLFIASDTSWTTANSRYTQIGKWRWNEMGGELINDQYSFNSWQELSSIHMNHVITVQKPEAKTAAQICPINIITDTILVHEFLQIEQNVWLVDFGKNFSGWMRMKIKNQIAVDTIHFIYSDFCNKTPERISKAKWDFGNRHIKQVDGYISSGNESGVFCPKFNYHAFRYVVIEGLNYKPDCKDIKGLMIESKLEKAGNFFCSDNDLNDINELNKFTFRCLDIGGYFVDCPHRERLGYGDGQAAVETGIFNFNLENFYKNWSINWLESQKEDGEFPNTSPSPYGAGGGPGWGGAGVVLPWKIFKYYGDTLFLQWSYKSMVRYMDFLESKSTGGLLSHYGDLEWGFIGDWVPPGRGMDSKEKVGKQEKELFNNCYKMYLYGLLVQSAEVLGYENAKRDFGEKSRLLREKINATYYNSDDHIFVNGEQPYLSFPLLLDVPSTRNKPIILNKLEHEIRVTNNGHLNTGNLGTYFMLQYLTEIGRSDLVYLIMKQKTYPGWGYMIAQGANTCWEQWNGYWSNIHSCFTSAGGWFFTGVAGIGQEDNSSAFKHMVISPQLIDKIEKQETWFDSPYGKVVIKWDRIEKGNLWFYIEIPANTYADVILPKGLNKTIYESDKLFFNSSDMQILSDTGDRITLSLKSGKYNFKIKNS